MRNLLLLLLACFIGSNASAQLNCNAAISASMNSSTSVVTVTNNSTPTATSNIYTTYTYVWHDGSPNTVVHNNNAVTHQYKQSGTFAIDMISHVLDSQQNRTCIDSATTSVTAPGVPCAVSITATKQSNTTYQFTANNLNNTPNLTYSWAYGDGNGGTGSPKTHTYASAGTYTVRLIGNRNGVCDDTAYTTVNVTVPQNRISGYVFYDSTNNPPASRDTFKVWLITFDSSTNILAAVDSQIVTGFYNFTNKASGNYRTKAHHLNGPTTGTGNVPTYHDSDLLWSNANIIAHNGGSTLNKHIYMKKGTVTTGPGFIGGNVQQGANKGTANGIEGLNVLILNSNGEPVAYDITDANGDFSANNLPVGTYTVHPEQLAFNTTVATVVVSAGNASHTDINFERSLSQKTIVPKTSSVVDVNDNKLSFIMYPNPAHNKVVLNWANEHNEVADVTITDISGKAVFNTQTRMQGQSVIEFGDLQTGFYMLNVSSTLGSSTHKLFIQH